MSERQHLGIYAVLAHQQPAREALFHIMQAIACSDLRHLQLLHENIALNQLP